MYKGDVMRTTYEWINLPMINKETFLKAIGTFPKTATLTFPVRMEDGRIEVKTVKWKNLHKIASNNFCFNTKAIGSD